MRLADNQGLARSRGRGEGHVVIENGEGRQQRFRQSVHLQAFHIAFVEHGKGNGKLRLRAVRQVYDFCRPHGDGHLKPPPFLIYSDGLKYMSCPYSFFSLRSLRASVPGLTISRRW